MKHSNGSPGAGLSVINLAQWSPKTLRQPACENLRLLQPVPQTGDSSVSGLLSQN